MSTLSLQIDRLTQHANAIQRAALQTATRTESNKFGIAGPFTRAILDTALGDLIRDVDASELGLFTLTAASNRTDVKTAAEPDVARTQFTGATPLRKPPKQKQLAPEVYAQAALKYIERYYPIRAMPQQYQRAHSLLEQLDDVRERIQGLAEKLQSQAPQVPPTKAMADKEESRVKELEAKLALLKARKEAAMEHHRAAAASPPSPTTPLATKGDKFVDDSPFITPAANAKPLRFTTSMLLDEDIEMGDTSVASFASPVKGRPSRSIFQLEDEDQTTRRPTTPPTSRRARSPSPPPVSSNEDAWAARASSVTTPTKDPQPAANRKMRITAETERIAAKIWSILSDMLMPGMLANQTPTAKETISHLRALSNMKPPPASPSLSSLTSGSSGTLDQPTQQQIMTAHLLYILLTSPNNHTLSMNEVKDSLTAKQDDIGGPGLIGQSATRVLYACVAKRLIKIDRGGGEQHVRFDI